MKRFLIVSFFMFALPFQLLYLNLSKEQLYLNKGDIAGIKSNSEIINWVAIGDYRFTLFGYTSPFAVVTFDGQGIHDQAIADSYGYFEMANRFSPFSPREACLSAKDQFGRISSPVCLPPFPTKYTVSIGPVLLSPTLSLDKNLYYIGDKIILSGQTIPNSNVDLSLFLNSGSYFSMIKPVYAQNLTDKRIKSDSKGNYSISIPSSQAQSTRLFAQTNFKNNLSTESVKLNLKVYPWWMSLFFKLQLFAGILKSRLLEIIIIVEILYLAWFIYNTIHKISYHSKAIVLKENSNIVLTVNHEIQKYHKPAAALLIR